VQPKLRKRYTDNKGGVDGIDQKEAASITQHGSKVSPWHRVHDDAMAKVWTLTLEHYQQVMIEFGSKEQKERQVKDFHNTSKVRKTLFGQITEGSGFGSLAHGAANLNRGRFGGALSSFVEEVEGESGDDGEECEEEGKEAGPRVVQRRQGDEHVWRVAATRGMCAIKGCGDQSARYGCETCGVRLCGPDCQALHQRGRSVEVKGRKEVKWAAPLMVEG